MAFWNKNKAKDVADTSTVPEYLPQDELDPDLDDDYADLPEDDLPEDDGLQNEHNDTMEVEKMPDTDLYTSISRNAEVVGNIVTSDNLEVYGSIEGNINSEALVKVYGTVNGQISCATLIASGAKITGDITCNELVEVRGSTDIEGDIFCNSAIVSGNLLGNITAEHSTSLSETAVVSGNISTPEFEVAKGAVLNGSVSIKKEMPRMAEMVNTPPVTIAVQSKPEPVEETSINEQPLDDILEEAE